MKLQARPIRITENPKKPKRKRTRSAPAGKKRGRWIKRRRTVRRYIVELMAEKSGQFQFSYIKGAKLTKSMGAAKKFKSENQAAEAARKLMKRLGANYRFARVISA